MATMFDYLDWYGDLTFDATPFNEVDALILANLSYVAMDGVVGGLGEPAVSVAEAAQGLVERLGKQGIYDTPSFGDPTVALLPQKMAKGARFRDATLSAYVREQGDDGEARQFAALTIGLPGLTYVSYRGTDDTLVAWHENFDMSYEVVPAQTQAASYLAEVAARTQGPLHVGGHSKGGNLAVFAASHVEEAVRERIVTIWDEDGPGFRDAVIPPSALAPVRDKVRLYVPSFDIVGQLLCRQTPTKVVRSENVGMMQHSAVSWEVLGDHLVQADPDRIDPVALAYSKDFNDWFQGATNETRRHVFDAFFGAMERAGMHTLTELTSGAPRPTIRLLEQLGALDAVSRRYAISLVVALSGSYLDEVWGHLTTRARAAIGAVAESVRERGGVPLDDATPLSAAEMHRYRELAAEKRTAAEWLSLLGSTPGKRAFTLGAVAALAVGAGALVWRLARPGR